MEMVSSVTDQCDISPLLLANIDPDAITHSDLRIAWEELLGEPVDLGSERMPDLFNSEATLPIVACQTNWMNC